MFMGTTEPSGIELQFIHANRTRKSTAAGQTAVVVEEIRFAFEINHGGMIGRNCRLAWAGNCCRISKDLPESGRWNTRGVRELVRPRRTGNKGRCACRSMALLRGRWRGQFLLRGPKASTVIVGT